MLWTCLDTSYTWHVWTCNHKCLLKLNSDLFLLFKQLLTKSNWTFCPPQHCGNLGKVKPWIDACAYTSLSIFATCGKNCKDSSYMSFRSVRLFKWCKEYVWACHAWFSTSSWLPICPRARDLSNILAVVQPTEQRHFVHWSGMRPRWPGGFVFHMSSRCTNAFGIPHACGTETSARSCNMTMTFFSKPGLIQDLSGCHLLCNSSGPTSDSWARSQQLLICSFPVQTCWSYAWFLPWPSSKALTRGVKIPPCWPSLFFTLWVPGKAGVFFQWALERAGKDVAIVHQTFAPETAAKLLPKYGRIAECWRTSHWASLNFLIFLLISKYVVWLWHAVAICGCCLPWTIEFAMLPTHFWLWRSWILPWIGIVSGVWQSTSSWADILFHYFFISNYMKIFQLL